MALNDELQRIDSAALKTAASVNGRAGRSLSAPRSLRPATSSSQHHHQHHRRHGVSAGCPHSFLPRTRCSDDEKGARLISFCRHRPYSLDARSDEATRKRNSSTFYERSRLLSSTTFQRPVHVSPSKGTSKICLLSRCSPSLNVSRRAQHLRILATGRSFILCCTIFYYSGDPSPTCSSIFVSFEVVE